MAEELGVDVDVKEDDYCCARKPWINMGKTVCLSGGGGEPRRFSRPLPLRSSGGEKGASKMLRSRSSAENPKEGALSVALYDKTTVVKWLKWMQQAM